MCLLVWHRPGIICTQTNVTRKCSQQETVVYFCGVFIQKYRFWRIFRQRFWSKRIKSSLSDISSPESDTVSLIKTIFSRLVQFGPFLIKIRNLNIIFCHWHYNSNVVPTINKGSNKYVLYECNSNISRVKWLWLVFGSKFGLGLSYRL
jgi:hypothetical protein